MANDPPSINPEHTALLVMDYQVSVINRLGDAGELLSRMASAITSARNRRIHVGYAFVGFDDDDYTALPETNSALAAISGSRRLHISSPDTAIHSAVAPQPGDIVVRKTRYGAFSTTDLHHQLRDHGIDTLVLAGISTGGVVLSTVRAAADMDYRIYVLADCCADADPQVHEFLITKIFPRQSIIIDSAAFAHLVSGPRKGRK